METEYEFVMSGILAITTDHNRVILPLAASRKTETNKELAEIAAPISV